MTGACYVWKANLNLQNFDEAVQDFKAVLHIDPDNKAAKNQLAITTHKIKQIHNREKQTYAGMFQKFAEIDAKVSTTMYCDFWVIKLFNIIFATSCNLFAWLALYIHVLFSCGQINLSVISQLALYSNYLPHSYSI